MKNDSKNLARSIRIKLLMSSLSVIVLFLMLVIISFAWFSFETDTSSSGAVSVGKVKFAMRLTNVTDIFFTDFSDVSDSLTEEEEGEITYIPALYAVIVVGNLENLNTESTATDGTEYFTAYELKQDLNKKLILRFYDAAGNYLPGATYNLAWSSGTPDDVIITSHSGLMRAYGNVGSTATITVNATYADPEEGTPGVITASLSIIVIPAETSPENPGFLPGNTQILRNPLNIINYSTVPTKLRVKVEWKYYNLDADEVTSRVQISTEDILAEAGYVGSPQTLLSGLGAPIECTPAEGEVWNAAPSDGKLLFVDTNGSEWTISILSLTEAEKALFKKYILGTLEAGEYFVFDATMIDAAYIYFYSGVPAESGDYGDRIAPPSFADYANPTTEETEAAAINVFDGITITGSYTAFSTRKGFGITFTFQSRQAKAFAWSSWSDVYRYAWTTT